MSPICPATSPGLPDIDAALQEYLREGRIRRELVEYLAKIVYLMLLEESRQDRERVQVVFSSRGPGR